MHALLLGLVCGRVCLRRGQPSSLATAREAARFYDDATQPPEEEDAPAISYPVRPDARARQFKNWLGCLVACADEHGHCKVPSAFRTTDGAALGPWVKRQRVARSKGTLSTSSREQLEAIGFVWDAQQHEWRANYEHLVAYAGEHGHCDVPFRFRTTDGAALGVWVYNQRQTQTKGTLKTNYREQLEALGFVWNALDGEWRATYERLVTYVGEHGHCKVPSAFRTTDGTALGAWVSSQRIAQTKDVLSAKRREQLDALGFEWDMRDLWWRESYERLVAYIDEHGHCKVPRAFRTTDGAALGQWVCRQRIVRAKGKLSAERSDQLERIGFT